MTPTSAAASLPGGSSASSREVRPRRTVSGVRRSWAKAAFRRRRSSICAQCSRLSSSSAARIFSKDSHSRPSSLPQGTSTVKPRSFSAIFSDAALSISMGRLSLRR